MRLLPALMLTAVSVASAQATELSDFAASFAQSDAQMVFSYSAPEGGFTLETARMLWAEDRKLVQALIETDGVDPMSGVDFSKATGLLEFGLTPNSVRIVFGEDGLTDGVDAALSAREFDTIDIDDVPVFGLGADDYMDIAAAREPDPFNGELGRAQRIAPLGDAVIATTNWATMRSVLGADAQKNKMASVWRATFDGLESATGGLPLQAAIGWRGDAFMGAAFDPAIMLDIDPSDFEALEEAVATAEPTMNFPAFPLAIFALDSSAIRIALPYGDPATAHDAAEYVRDALADIPDLPADPQAILVDARGLSIAVISIPHGQEATEAATLFQNWLMQSSSGSFAPLQFGTF